MKLQRGSNRGNNGAEGPVIVPPPRHPDSPSPPAPEAVRFASDSRGERMARALQDSAYRASDLPIVVDHEDPGHGELSTLSDLRRVRTVRRVKHLAHLPRQNLGGEGLLEVSNARPEHAVAHHGIVGVAGRVQDPELGSQRC